MRYNIYLIMAVFLLLLQPVNSQRVVDFDKDSIPDNQDKYPFDYDNDGLPDDWEKTHDGLRWDINDAHLDRDNDGISNLQEYRKTLIKKPPITEQLKNIPLEKVLLISLIIGIVFIAIGIVLYLHKKKKQPKRIHYHPMHHYRPSTRPMNTNIKK
ncbi:hypothetical protein KY361_03570 [Candidatus Woesearchaeota archaeon]|nr:hypothetical protein [Candidatus Woesearchaeota archaeon]